MQYKNFCRLSFNFFLALLISGFNTDAQQTLTGNLSHNGINRNYRLRLPAGHTANESVPLVFNLHGFTSNAIQQELYSGMNVVADSARFAVCYPNGIATSWNVGWSFGSNADDVGFISALIEDLILKYGFDRTRVYACGMSNGGFMSYRLACELSDKIAAVASVTGSIVPGRLTQCDPGRPMPVMIVHGTADDVVPYTGSAISLPVKNVMDFWIEYNGCDADPEFSIFPNINTSDNSTAERYVFSQCSESASVEHIKIIGGGHTWPGSLINNGVTNRDINASAEIWRFFKNYSLPESTSSSKDVTNQINIKIYPNPVSDILMISSDFEIGECIVRDISGRTVLNFKPVSDYFSAELRHLDKGVYFLTMVRKNQNHTIKFIKQ